MRCGRKLAKDGDVSTARGDACAELTCLRHVLYSQNT